MHSGTMTHGVYITHVSPHGELLGISIQEMLNWDKTTSVPPSFPKMLYATKHPKKWHLDPKADNVSVQLFRTPLEYHKFRAYKKYYTLNLDRVGGFYRKDNMVTIHNQYVFFMVLNVEELPKVLRDVVEEFVNTYHL